MVHKKIIQFYKQLKGVNLTHTCVVYAPSWQIATRISQIKRKVFTFDITHQPELCAYVTHLPVDNYNTDAAVLYKDIMTPLKPIGVDVEIQSGIGPVIHNPIKSVKDVEKLTQIDPKRDVPYVLETIKILTEEKLNVPLIGFTGAPLH